MKIMKPIIKEIAVMLNLATNSRFKIVTYLFEMLTTNGNVLKITIRELSEELGVCTNVVTFTLKKLEQEGIIRRRTGTIMLESDILYRWQADRNQAGGQDQTGVNINIQMDQNHFGAKPQATQRNQHHTREVEREAAFSNLFHQKNDETLERCKSEIKEREKAVRKREKACELQENALKEREKNLAQWEKRIDALLGLKSEPYSFR
jgi:DNA-binding Lrp family transcriptional regulator